MCENAPTSSLVGSASAARVAGPTTLGAASPTTELGPAAQSSSNSNHRGAVKWQHLASTVTEAVSELLTEQSVSGLPRRATGMPTDTLQNIYGFRSEIVNFEVAVCFVVLKCYINWRDKEVQADASREVAACVLRERLETYVGPASCHGGKSCAPRPRLAALQRLAPLQPLQPLQPEPAVPGRVDPRRAARSLASSSPASPTQPASPGLNNSTIEIEAINAA